MGRHLAFKCTYNDGDEGDLVGFHGICSLDNIKRNIENGHDHRCNHPECPCKKYYDRGFTGSRPTVSFCYESSLFRDWRFGAGFSQHGSRKVQLVRIRDAAVGRVAILTTSFPKDVEIDRKIIGLFRIGEVNSDEETIVIADEKHRVRLPLEEAKVLYLWDYYQNPNSPKSIWGRGLFRYLTDAQVARIVKDVQETVRDEHTRNVLGSLLQEVWKDDDVPPASGPRAKMYPSRTRRVAVGRKYGPTGEGSEHKRLKEWLAHNPGRLGYKDVVEVTVETLRRC
jgi:hypothetical protein